MRLLWGTSPGVSQPLQVWGSRRRAENTAGSHGAAPANGPPQSLREQPPTHGGAGRMSEHMRALEKHASAFQLNAAWEAGSAGTISQITVTQ